MLRTSICPWLCVLCCVLMAVEFQKMCWRERRNESSLLFLKLDLGGWSLCPGCLLLKALPKPMPNFVKKTQLKISPELAVSSSKRFAVVCWHFENVLTLLKPRGTEGFSCFCSVWTECEARNCHVRLYRVNCEYFTENARYCCKYEARLSVVSSTEPNIHSFIHSLSPFSLFRACVCSFLHLSATNLLFVDRVCMCVFASTLVCVCLHAH